MPLASCLDSIIESDPYIGLTRFDELIAIAMPMHDVGACSRSTRTAMARRGSR
jgi:hypothetical protein